MELQDNAKKILYLTLVIKMICEENGLSKSNIIDDFIYLIDEKHEKDKTSWKKRG